MAHPYCHYQYHGASLIPMKKCFIHPLHLRPYTPQLRKYLFYLQQESLSITGNLIGIYFV